MLFRFFITTLIVSNAWLASAQSISYSPQILIGHRSTAYLHIIDYKINSKFSFNNLTYTDSEFNSDKNTIFFIRNTGSYALTKRLFLNLAVGVKNPGKFATTSLQYLYIKNNFFTGYSVGTTLQNTFTLEQSLSFRYSHLIKNQLKAYYSLLIIFNTANHQLDRGIQQVRVGINQKQSTYGLGANYDQFNNTSRTLFNVGIFFSHNIKSKS